MILSVAEAVVSIRSPHRSEGRFYSVQVFVVDTKQFQSAPPTEVRGDTLVWRRVALVEVSIRSPHRSEGRYKKTPTAAKPYTVFQSAPPTEVRGDTHPSPRSALHTTVSIRSPHRSEGRSNGFTKARSWP